MEQPLPSKYQQPDPSNGHSSLRLIRFREACRRRGISKRSYYDDRSLLPKPIRLTPGDPRSPLLFAEHEVEAMIADLLDRRGEGPGQD